MNYVSYHKELNPLLWDGFRLKKDVRKKLLKIGKFFVAQAEIPKEYVVDYVITGSNANFNYSKYSDLDLHIIVRIPEHDKDLYQKYLNCKKKILNEIYDIKIKRINVEVYFQLEDEVHFSSGVYSLTKNEWIIKPEYKKPIINSTEIKSKAEKMLSQIRSVESCNDYKKLKKLFEKIKKFRKAGLSKHGEFSAENIIFKAMRNSGLLEQLLKCMNRAVSKELSLENISEGIKITKKDIENVNLNAVKVGFEFEVLFLFPIKNFPEIEYSLEEYIRKQFQEEELERLGYWEGMPFSEMMQIDEINDFVLKYMDEIFYPVLKEKRIDIEYYLEKQTGIKNIKIYADYSVLSDDNKKREYLHQGIIFYPAEIITPPLYYDVAMYLLDEILDMIKEGYLKTKRFSFDMVTTETSGLHVNISVDPETPEFSKLNKIYALMLSSLDYLLELFDNEKMREKYAKKIEKDVIKFLTDIINHYSYKNTKEISKLIVNFLNDLVKNKIQDESVLYEINRFMKEKYRVVNFGKSEYLEFRVLGGKNYESRKEEIIKNISKFVYITWESSTGSYSKLDEIIKRTAKKIIKKISEMEEGNLNIEDDFSIKIEEKDLQKIRNYAKKFGNLEEEVKKALFMLKYTPKYRQTKGDEHIFVFNTKMNLVSTIYPRTDVFNKNVVNEFFDRNEKGEYVFNFEELYNKLRKNPKDLAKFTIVAKNLLNRNELSDKKIVEEVYRTTII